MKHLTMTTIAAILAAMLTACAGGGAGSATRSAGTVTLEGVRVTGRSRVTITVRDADAAAAKTNDWARGSSAALSSAVGPAARSGGESAAEAPPAEPEE